MGHRDSLGTARCSIPISRFLNEKIETKFPNIENFRFLQQVDFETILRFWCCAWSHHASRLPRPNGHVGCMRGQGIM